MFDSATVLPRTSLTLEQARTQLSGLHFAKEMLSKGESEILYTAEALLRLIDSAPKQVFVVSYTPEQYVDSLDIAVVTSLQRAREVIEEDVTKHKGKSLASFEQDENSLSVDALENGVDVGAYYSAYAMTIS